MLSLLIWVLVFRDAGLLSILLLTAVYGAIGYGWVWLASSLALSSIPAAWYGLTAYGVSLAGYGPTITWLDEVLIFLRALAYSEIILFIASIISPVKIMNLMIRLGGKTSPLIPPLVWRLTPLGLRFMAESMEVGRLKGESARMRLAPAIGVMLNVGGKVLEANHLRLDAPPAYPVIGGEDGKAYDALLLATSIILVLIPLLYVLRILL